MRKFRICRYGLFGHIFDVQVNKWYGWVLVKRFKAEIRMDFLDAFNIKYSKELAEELLEKLEEE